MPLCSVPGCSNSGVHLFPKDVTLKRKWELAIRRKNFVATQHSRLCRNHFHESDYVGESLFTGCPQIRRFLKKGTVPSIFPWPNRVSKTPKMFRRLKRIRKKFFRPLSEDPEEEESIMEPPTSTEVVYIATTTESSAEDSPPRAVSVGIQCGSSGILSIEAMRDNQQAIFYYTGLENYEKFMLVLDTLIPMCDVLNYKENEVTNVTTADQLLLTLIKLRRYPPDLELAFLFGISQTNVSNIFVTWINFMSEIWNLTNIWPSKELVRDFMPESFKREFASTRIIVDLIEIPITKPKNPVTQHATYSKSKHKNIVKAMIGATPGGLISYVSECYGGSINDRKIIEMCNLENLCDIGDSIIMADRGFNVQDNLAQKDNVNIPFMKGKTQIPDVKVQDRNQASKTMHIERNIGLTKTFKILKCKLSPSLVPLASRMLFVCAMLSNFRENNIKK